MSNTLNVLMNGTFAGLITQDGQGHLRFEYDEEYRRTPDVAPLSVSMPLQIRAHADQFIRPWLTGLLPDDDGVVRRWGREFQVSTASPFSLLSTPIGLDCAGAVQFVPPDQIETTLARPGQVDWLTDEQVADRLRDLSREQTAWLGRPASGQFSLAGAQAKTALLLENGRWGVPSGPLPTTHILKPAISGLEDHDLNEHLCLDAAHRVGLVSAETQVLQFDDQSALVATRYDRLLIPDGSITRVHQEDLCQALSVPPTLKYQKDGGPNPTQIVRLLRGVMDLERAEESVWRFTDALIWNWLIAGTDAHAKNYSLLLSGNQVRLAPLYDVASALPYGYSEHELKLAMTIGSRYDAFPRHDNWPRAARDLGLNPVRLVERVRELARQAPFAFAAAAHEPAVTALGRPLPARLTELIADRCERCLKLVEG